VDWELQQGVSGKWQVNLLHTYTYAVHIKAITDTHYIHCDI